MRRLPVLFALVTCAVQLAFCLACSRRASLADAYASLNQWDTGWYLGIAAEGYETPDFDGPPHPWSIAFFPGYPLVGRMVAKAFGLELLTALMLTAQLAAVCFWWLFYGRLQRSGASPAVMGICGLFLAAFPSAFFLQAPYSESLFLAALLAVLAAQEREPPRALGAIVAGVMLTSTRLLGAPLALLPVVRSALLKRPRPLRTAAIAAVSLCGAGAFIGYCVWRFGRADAYAWAQRTGWHLDPEPWALLRPSTWFHLALPRNLDPFVTNGLQASRFATTVGLWLFVAVAAAEWILRHSFAVRGLRGRLPYYLGAGVAFVIPATAFAALGFASMVRYALPPLVLLMIAQIDLWGRSPPELRRVRLGIAAALVSVALYMALIQAHLIAQFCASKFVA